MVMAVFAYIYHQSFIIPESVSVEIILDQVHFLACSLFLESGCYQNILHGGCDLSARAGCGVLCYTVGDVGSQPPMQDVLVESVVLFLRVCACFKHNMPC